ncbi:nitroreductase family deazaflavin-dependent oxidoreductase [Dictyobacter formicarum]|uniref:Nitroreductase n=1 Tax=Dictyobacter formicarum TaxID=2778368 RepID=A0ABQ3VJE1_9CHLR|nr:nitroreductase family deazaflavin-dependent oxidoreductase [Dictyobacter formicarum]GHO85776.1 hypothetical protein KSZ_37820 [Dictyobacter formicarum]
MSNWTSEKVKDWNNQVVAEFRANGGKVGGQYENGHLLLLTTIGRKSGEPRITPLAYQADGDRLIVVASFMGSPQHPAWYLNLLAHPEVIVEVGNETFKAIASDTDPSERERLLEKWPFVKQHQELTSREIPFVALRRLPS